VILSALLASILIGSISLGWEFSQRGLFSYTVWVVILGAGWLLAVWRGWNWFSSFALIIFTIVAGLGLWFGFDPGWMFAGCIFSLFAWDLTDFRTRLRLMAKDDEVSGIERRHLARISLLALAALFLASIVMLVRVRFTFEWGVLLVLVILFGLGQLVSWYKR
jgi:hypothetical protein